MIRHILTAAALSFCIISISVILTLNFRFLYYMDMKYYDLSEKTGYSETEILENYDALIQYNSPFYKGHLQFPSLPMSESARIHFSEVKMIFDTIQLYIFPISLLISIIGIRSLKKQKPTYLKLTFIFTLIVPLCTGLFTAASWDSLFIFFHELAFENNYWIFNSLTDPIILLLPDEYFMHCTLMILLLIFVSSTVCLLCYKYQLPKWSKSINPEN